MRYCKDPAAARRQLGPLRGDQSFDAAKDHALNNRRTTER
ncbi:hypothetical protein DFJ75_0030 [Williamsia muralis]|uniref:Uncharacterized protein n=1 Tax=Williamsia marianensis TaxID=85044 RepID=A0A495JWL8_WILMA|nr:hypothetical protein DFJ75_0030 [Williamsia muralis]